jgi:hypothetical protein
MDQSAYDGILDRLDDVTGGRRSYGLVGSSIVLEEFVAAIAALAVELHESPNSPPGSAGSSEKRPRGGRENAAGAKGSSGPRDSVRPGRRPLGVIIGRPVADNSLDASLLELCGRDASWAEVRLAPNADTYNSVQLFGLGTRSSPFESPTGPVVIVRGLEHLPEAGRRRFSRHLQAWCRDHPDAGLRPVHVVMLVGTGGGPSSLVRSLVEEIGGVLECCSLEMPPLNTRPEDIPFLLHDLARGYGGHLRDFQRDGLGKLVAYRWPGDLAELKLVVRRLYGPDQTSGSRRFSPPQIQEAIDRGRTEAKLPAGTGDPRSLWGLIDQRCDECDKRCSALMATPFFASGTTATAPDPWSSDWPELVYVRLVSWAYMKFIEEAEPNLGLALKFFSGLGQGPVEEAIRGFKKTLGRLRTFEQHRLEYDSESDQQTLLTAQTWFERACGSRLPSDQHFERCSLALLQEIDAVLRSIVAFLVALEHDEYRDTILGQWHAGRTRSWPKHAYAKLVTGVLADLGRADLRPDVVTDRLLPALQKQLEVLEDDADKARCLRVWLERRIAAEFPSPPLIDGEDLRALGYLPGRDLGVMKKHLNGLAAKGGVTREELLDIARRELVQKSSDAAEVPPQV